MGQVQSKLVLKRVAIAEERTPDAAPLATEFYSQHIESLREAMDTVDVNDAEAKKAVEIEASKRHWSELLPTAYFSAVDGPTMGSLSTSQLERMSEEEEVRKLNLEVAEDNKAVFRSLQEKYPGGFFLHEDDTGPDHIHKLPKWMICGGKPKHVEFRLSSEKPFAEGAQAQLFHAHAISIDDGMKRENFVMKVFKKGMSLRDLQKLFAPTMLTHDDTRIEGFFGAGSHCNAIGGARLLELESNGRFAFVMERAWGDLRKLIDMRMLHINNQVPLFSNTRAIKMMLEIAKGMQSLHEKDIIHRDLKAANVLICMRQDDITNFDPILLESTRFHCGVADYECSIGVIGTRYWRAPEILLGEKSGNIWEKSELFTKQSDVYSFGMTCYEILSGCIPFENLRSKDYGCVIGGTRPILPKETTPWVNDLVSRCWHKDPSMRPTFSKIVKILKLYL